MMVGNKAMKKLNEIAEALVVNDPSTMLRQKNTITL